MNLLIRRVSRNDRSVTLHARADDDRVSCPLVTPGDVSCLEPRSGQTITGAEWEEFETRQSLVSALGAINISIRMRTSIRLRTVSSSESLLSMQFGDADLNTPTRATAKHHGARHARRNLSALPTTDTELNDIAAAAKRGDNSMPRKG